MIRAARDAIGTILGWLFQCAVQALCGKRFEPQDDRDGDGEPNS